MDDAFIERVYGDINLVGYTRLRSIIESMGGFDEYSRAGPMAAIPEEWGWEQEIADVINNYGYHFNPNPPCQFVRSGNILTAYRNQKDDLLADFRDAVYHGNYQWMGCILKNNDHTQGRKKRAQYKKKRSLSKKRQSRNRKQNRSHKK